MRMLNIRETAEYLNLKSSLIRRLMLRGDLQFKIIGKKRYYTTPEWCEEFIGFVDEIPRKKRTHLKLKVIK